MKRLVLDNELVMQWVLARLPGRGAFEKGVGIGIARDGKLIGGVVYYNYRPQNDIEVAVAADDVRWLTPDLLRGLFYYPFGQLQCRRMTALVEKRNKRSRAFVEKLGFAHEGTHKECFDGRDGLSYGLLKRNCKFFGEVDGQTNKVA